MITAGTRPLSRIAGARPLLERLERGVGAEPAARVLLGTSYGYACRFEEAQARSTPDEPPSTEWARSR